MLFSTRFLLSLIVFFPVLGTASEVADGTRQNLPVVSSIDHQLGKLSGIQGLHRMEQAIENGELSPILAALDEELARAEQGERLGGIFTLDEFFGLIRRRREDSHRHESTEENNWIHFRQHFRRKRMEMSRQNREDLVALSKRHSRFQVSQRMDRLNKLRDQLKPSYPEASRFFQNFLWTAEGDLMNDTLSQKARLVGRSYETKAWLASQQLSHLLSWESCLAVKYALEKRGLEELEIMLQQHPDHPLSSPIHTLKTSLQERFQYQWEKAYLKALAEGKIPRRNSIEQEVGELYAHYLDARKELQRSLNLSGSLQPNPGPCD